MNVVSYLDDINLIFAIITINMWIILEFINPFYGHTSLILEKKRFKMVSYLVTLTFLIILTVRIYLMLV
jgi:hypothetical protein